MKEAERGGGQCRHKSTGNKKSQAKLITIKKMLSHKQMAGASDVTEKRNKRRRRGRDVEFGGRKWDREETEAATTPHKAKSHSALTKNDRSEPNGRTQSNTNLANSC